jgi:hypothetical protein
MTGLPRTAAAAARPDQRSAAEQGNEMPNYLHKAGGTLQGGFPWSIGLVSTSSATESAAQTNWDNGILAMWSLAAFNALMAAGSILTYTSTSTATASFTQTTKTQTTHNLPGAGVVGLPFQVAEVVTWRTASATKWGRGRWYLPSMGTNALATSGFVLAASAQATIVTAMAAARAAWAGTLNFQILHRHNTLAGPLALTLTPIVNGDVSNKLVIQRRRADKYTPVRSTFA